MRDCQAEGAKVHPRTGNRDIHRMQVLAGGGEQTVRTTAGCGGIGAVMDGVVEEVPRPGRRSSFRASGQKC